MLKRKIDEYLKNWFKNRKTALLVDGARQIGKTYSIENFIKNNTKNYVIVNFAEQSDRISLFSQLKNSEQLTLNLSLIAGNLPADGKTIIFFDEVQLLYQRRNELKKAGKLDLDSQDIITAMKHIVIDGKYRLILSGSLLGVYLTDIMLMPTGYMDEIRMFPLDFEEFLWSKGVGSQAIEYLKSCFETKKYVDENINKLFLSYFREYVLTGGMPEAVEIYNTKKNLFEIQNIHNQILSKYTYDITFYTESYSEKMKIREIYNAIPSELNSKNKRFISTHILDLSYIKNKTYGDEFIWLAMAGVALPVYNVTEPILPLELSAKHRTLKLFLSDTGMLCSMLFSSGIKEKLLTGEKVINYGAPYENAITQELYAHGYYDKLYYYNSKKHGEVDFILQYENEILPIEIKSGKPNDMLVYNHTALNNLIKIYSPNKALVFGEGNVKKETDTIYSLPIYMIMFIENSRFT